MVYGRFPKTETVESRKLKASKALIRLMKKQPDLEPVILSGTMIAKSWWGKAWNLNLERYADFSNRVGRGKTYVRSNAVLDLKITEGKVRALVQGSAVKPYSVYIDIKPLHPQKWQAVTDLCDHRIDSLDQLLDGKFPKELEALFNDVRYGLFPSPDEIRFDCTCPDGAYMCKHVAAALYGVGARLDVNPMVFFELRALNGMALVRKSIDAKVNNLLINAGEQSQRGIDDADISKIFGL